MFTESLKSRIKDRISPIKNPDTYRTLAARSTGEFRDRGSKFFAYAYPITTEGEWQTALDEVRAEHPKARHHCYAYRLGTDGNRFRANDDGEPSGTAGKPILGRIDSFELTDVGIVVVRYFGGTLLGASGLINAYRTAAEAALENGEIIEKLETRTLRLTFSYAHMPAVMNAVKKFDLDVREQILEHEGTLRIALPKSEAEELVHRLKLDISGLYAEQLPKELEGLKFEWE